jgi:hypothetical protein
MKLKQRVQKGPLQELAARSAAAPTPVDLQLRIAEAAYFRAERRGFAPGSETEDWLAAEAEIMASMAPAQTAGAES